MARSFEITLPPARRDSLVQSIEGKPGIVGMSLQRGASIDPKGDVLTVWATNEGAGTVLHALDTLGLGDDGSFTISEPTAMVVPSRQHAIAHETNEGSWEEMASLLRRDTNPSVNFLLLMTVAGYGCLAAAAAVTLVVLGTEAGPGAPALGDRPLIRYWTAIGYSDALVALAAGAAGATIVSSRRTVFSAGVMVALGMIPAMAIVGMALVFGEPGLAGKGLLRWGVDVVCVLVSSSTSWA